MAVNKNSPIFGLSCPALDNSKIKLFLNIAKYFLFPYQFNHPPHLEAIRQFLVKFIVLTPPKPNDEAAIRG